MKKLTILVTVLSLLVLPACLKRREIVTIDGEGRIRIQHSLQGDEADLDRGPDAMPTGKPWRTSRAKWLKEDGTEEHRLEASATFANAAEVPTSFAPDDDRAGSLVFETSLREVRVEETRRVFLFRRVYRARPWADYDQLFRSRVPDDLAEKLEKPGDIGRLEGDDQERALQVLVDYEIAKMVLWARTAIAGLDLHDEFGPLLATHRIRTALEAWRRENLGPEQVSGFMSLGDQALVATCEDMVAATKEIIRREAAAVLGADPRWNAILFERLRAAAEKEHDVSQDLQDEDFELVLKLPGTLVTDGGGTMTDAGLRFRFRGRDLLDRNQVIEVLYALPRE